MALSTARVIKLVSLPTFLLLILQGTMLHKLSVEKSLMRFLDPIDSFSVPPDDTTTTSTPAQQQKKSHNATKAIKHLPNYEPRDESCPFRDSPIYRSIYVYPSPNSEDWKGDILSPYGKDRNISWPWIATETRTRKQGIAHFDANNKDFNQYTTELLVKEIITNPNSCLRTNNPESATLFYVPWLPSVEYHNGKLYGSYQTSPFGQALMDATDGKYEMWERTFGLTSKYWKRRNGSDHILVFSEPCHGLYHPRSKRGNFHFVYSQKQLAPPIVISVELSRTFVEMYPNCARKNILMPYPNTDGKWFNGVYDERTLEMFQEHNLLNVTESKAALPGEKLLQSQSTATSNMQKRPRPFSQFYGAGNHGTCKALRQIMTINFGCTESGKLASKHSKYLKHQHGYRQATFCPCPGGDTPSAKRMFDALHAGCIPIILSHDFVWPFTKEFDAVSSPLLNPSDFSIRLDAKLYQSAKYDKQCQLKNKTNTPTDIQSFIESVSAQDIEKLRQAAWKASDRYAYYKKRPDLPENPLGEGILPDGGAAHNLVKMLSERASGKLWPACQQDLSKRKKQKDKVNQFKC